MIQMWMLWWRLRLLVLVETVAVVVVVVWHVLDKRWKAQVVQGNGAIRETLLFPIVTTRATSVNTRVQVAAAAAACLTAVNATVSCLTTTTLMIVSRQRCSCLIEGSKPRTSLLSSTRVEQARVAAANAVDKLERARIRCECRHAAFL
jgi:hypothetical protein